MTDGGYDSAVQVGKPYRRVQGLSSVVQRVIHGMMDFKLRKTLCN